MAGNLKPGAKSSSITVGLQFDGSVGTASGYEYGSHVPGTSDGSNYPKLATKLLAPHHLVALLLSIITNRY